MENCWEEEKNLPNGEMVPDFTKCWNAQKKLFKVAKVRSIRTRTWTADRELRITLRGSLTLTPTLKSDTPSTQTDTYYTFRVAT